MYNIFVIGTGQLGRRHIEGLTGSKYELNILAYDQDEAALRNCYEHFIGIGTRTNKNLKTTTEINFCNNKKIDLVIVATPASNRPELLNQYFSCIDSRFWLIEKPISQSILGLDKLATGSLQNKYWVNHWRRSVVMYKKIKSKLLESVPLSIKISGADLGIACNISHYVDLMNFLTNEIPKKTCTKGLSDNWHKSKRKGFYEIDGSLKIGFSKGSNLEIDSRPNLKSYEIEIHCNMPNENLTFQIDEIKGTIKYKDQFLTNLKFPYQSQMSGQIFDNLIDNGICNLTPLNTAIACHEPVIKALVKHWNSTMADVSTSTIPIT